VNPDPRYLRHVIGLDLGKQSDYSALALLRWSVATPEERVARVYTVPTLKRWVLGTPYTQVADDLVRFYRLPVFTVPPLLCIDATGVGEPVVEMVVERLVAAQVRGGVLAVVITGGFRVGAPDRNEPALVPRWSVPKRTLASTLTLQVLLGNRRLHVSPALAEAKTLVRELGSFSVKLSPAGNESFEAWREADKDDLVLAVALAAWCAETLCDEPAPDRGPTRYVTT
jgi:hypothetical protein